MNFEKYLENRSLIEYFGLDLRPATQMHDKTIKMVYAPRDGDQMWIVYTDNTYHYFKVDMFNCLVSNPQTKEGHWPLFVLEKLDLITYEQMKEFGDAEQAWRRKDNLEKRRKEWEKLNKEFGNDYR